MLLRRYRTPNGRIVRVGPNHPHVKAGDYTLVPSERSRDTGEEPPGLGDPNDRPLDLEVPGANASKNDWLDYATSVPAEQGGLTHDEADAMTRDDLVAHFTQS